MIKHELKQCARCGATFECKVGSILLCQCYAVRLTQDERDYIRKTWDDCLCASCLKELKIEYHEENYKKTIKALIGDLY